MTTTEYLINAALIGLVLMQLRGVTITKAALAFPIVMTLWAGSQFLQSLPTAGNDLVLEIGGAFAGAGLGALAGWATAVNRRGATAIAKAGLVAAILWVLGIGARVAFSLWMGHGGRPAIERFSTAHHITTGAAWGAAFILMALAEVLSRTGVLYVKARRTGATIERGGQRHRRTATA